MHASWGPSRTGSQTPLHCQRDVMSPSPPLRGRRSDDRCLIVVERVIKEALASVQYPMLTRSNYNEWSLLMQVSMQAQSLWPAIDPKEEDTIEYWEDRLAFTAILRSVPPEMLSSLATKCTAQSAWEAIKSCRVGVQRVHKANAEQLMKEC
jgi:hypothetical protein